MSDWISLLFLGAAIGSNNLAAALSLGSLGAGHRYRVAFVFGVFEFVIPLLGLWIGRLASQWLAVQAGWLGPVLLAVLGLWTMWLAKDPRREDHNIVRKASSWRGLVILAMGLSLDNLVIGFSLGLQQMPPLLVAAMIAGFSVAFTLLGMKLGEVAQTHWGRYAGMGSGLVLVVLAAALWLGWI